MEETKEEDSAAHLQGSSCKLLKPLLRWCAHICEESDGRIFKDNIDFFKYTIFTDVSNIERSTPTLLVMCAMRHTHTENS